MRRYGDGGAGYSILVFRRSKEPDISNSRSAFAVSLVFLLIALVGPLPRGVRQVIVAVVLSIWIVAGFVWLWRRYGKKAVLALSAVIGVMTVVSMITYSHDEPNRRAVAQIKERHAYYVGTRRLFFLTGPIDYVYFDETATDDDVRAFTEIDGLDELERLVVKGTPISNETARRFAKFRKLRSLFLERTNVTPMAVSTLADQLPNCEIEVR